MTDSPFFFTHIGDIEQSALLDNPWKSDAEQIRRHLSLLNAEEWSAYVLWPGPSGARNIFDVDDSVYPIIFLQAAGTKNRMALEWKTNRDGTFRQYALGHGGSREGDPSETVEFNNGETGVFVYPDELFEHEEAARIFVHFRLYGAPPAEYALRDLGLRFTEDGKSAAT